MCQPTHGKAARGRTSVCCLVSLAGSLRFFFQSSELAPSLLALCQCSPTTGRAAATNFNVEALSLSMRLSVIAAAVGGVVRVVRVERAVQGAQRCGQVVAVGRGCFGRGSRHSSGREVGKAAMSWLRGRIRRVRSFGESGFLGRGGGSGERRRGRRGREGSASVGSISRDFDEGLLICAKGGMFVVCAQQRRACKREPLVVGVGIQIGRDLGAEGCVVFRRGGETGAGEAAGLNDLCTLAEKLRSRAGHVRARGPAWAPHSTAVGSCKGAHGWLDLGCHRTRCGDGDPPTVIPSYPSSHASSEGEQTTPTATSSTAATPPTATMVPGVPSMTLPTTRTPT